MTFGLVSILSSSQCVSHFAALRHNLSVRIQLCSIHQAQQWDLPESKLGALKTTDRRVLCTNTQGSRITRNNKSDKQGVASWDWRSSFVGSWGLDLNKLKHVLILTMNILLNWLHSLMVLLCLAQGSFPILFAYHKKTDSRIIFKFSPFIVDMDSIIDVHVQYVNSSVIHNVEYPICCTCSIQFLSHN